MKPIIAIFSAPSGSGKSTIARAIVASDPRFAFSVSATTRLPRRAEQEGKDYYFMSVDEFKKHIAQGDFIEYEEVYPGKFYGTTKEEVGRILNEGKSVVFDVDVRGGISLKNYFGEQAINIFVKIPSMEVLRERLVARGTDSPEAIEERLAKAEAEMELAPKFDRIIVNDDLTRAIDEAKAAVAEKMGK